MGKPIKKILIVLLAILFAGTGALFGMNAYVKHVGSARILSADQAADLSDVDCILVLGCLVRKDGTPSDMLGDRLEQAIALYNFGASPKLLMSGDHRKEDYNEVGAMKQYAINAGIPSSDIFMDHAGFSTYESIYRAKKIFGANRIIIVTQNYHLMRALYIAEALGLDAYGVAADGHVYAGQAFRECREVLARAKDFIMALFKPKPTLLEDPVALNQSGNITD